MGEILLGKLMPYFVLGIGGMLLSVAMALWLFGVPLRGSFWLLFAHLVAVPAGGAGHGAADLERRAKASSSPARWRSIATFLPAFLLSGFIFDIGSMPAGGAARSRISFAARYFVAILTTLFLAGDVWSVIVPNALALLRHGRVLPRPHLAQRAQAAGVTPC